MPVEKRPAHPIRRGPPPESRQPPHKVRDNETLETVARKYGISAHHLVMHNFGTTDAAEINWYLREYVGCKVPTHDGKNWRFSNTADPGLIYIPVRVIQMDPVVIQGKLPIKLDATGPSTFLASEKFSLEFKFPPGSEPADLGYLLAQAKIYIEGEIKQQGGLLRTTVKKDQVKFAIEKKLTEETKLVVGVKIEEKSLTPIADAVSKGSTGSFAKALFAPFEASIKTAYHVKGPLSIVPEIGGEISKIPVIVRISFEIEDVLPLEGAPFKGKFVVKLGFNVGLSKKGWTWVADKVGRPVLRTFLTQGGRALSTVAEWLTAEGVLLGAAVAGGALLGTLGLTYLAAWVVQDAKHKGRLEGLSSWYVEGYVARVFGRPRPNESTFGFTQEELNFRQQLIVLGEKDAPAEARTALRNARHPAAGGSEGQVLAAYRDSLLAANNGRLDYAEENLRVALRQKAKKLAGL